MHTNGSEKIMIKPFNSNEKNMFILPERRPPRLMNYSLSTMDGLNRAQPILNH